jgi:uncharacterized protein (DUF1499 family)
MNVVNRFVLTSVIMMMACSSEREGALENRQLSPCPSSPNCVSTLAEEGDKFMEPLFFRIPSRDVQLEVHKVIEAMPRARIVGEEYGYIHAEFTSKIFRFVDDVEVVIDDQSQRVDFRSASRIGYYDFGANRRRMETICRSLTSKKGIFLQTDANDE